ncbi:MAG: DUF4382 domain-containing protein [Sphingobacteriia bacterium]|nr:MAG: DUF4382 domain-containing protein [Sphingobacteriia bacterium]
MFTLKPQTMKQKNTLYYVAAMLIIIAVIVSSCTKNGSFETPNGVQDVSLILTDAPAVYDQVLIDIKSVKILVDTSKDTRKKDSTNWERVGADKDRRCASGDSSLIWEDLGIKAGVYDVLKLRNGLDTTLATKTVVNGVIRLIKIEFGTNNSVMKDSVSYPLLIPALAPNYVIIKLKGHEFEEFLTRKKRLWLDFDIANSIVQERNNQFYLRPWFKSFTVKTTASVVGKVTPMEAKPIVMVFNNTDTSYALPNKDGYFKIRGLKEGSYTVYVNASNGYFGKTISNITVSSTKEVSLGLIELKK